MKRTAGERWECAGCGERLVGAQTINDRVAPIETKITPSGNCVLFKADGIVRVATFGGEMLEEMRRQGFEMRMNHFSTCPERKRFERKPEAASA